VVSVLASAPRAGVEATLHGAKARVIGGHAFAPGGVVEPEEAAVLAMNSQPSPVAPTEQRRRNSFSAESECDGLVSS